MSIQRPRPDVDDERYERWLREEDDRLALEEAREWRADRIAEYAPLSAWPLIELGEGA